LWEVLDINLHDQRQAWVLEPDGHYIQLHPSQGATGAESTGSHQALMDLARIRSKA
jgi:polyphosphate kinase